MEFVAVILMVALFAALAPIASSRKRAETQKLLSKVLLERKFAVSRTVPLLDKALYFDNINGTWFFRKNLFELDPAIRPGTDISMFEVLSDGNVIAKFEPGKKPSGSLLTGEKGGEPTGGTCSSLQLLIYTGGYSPELVIPLLREPASRRFFEYHAAISSAKDACDALVQSLDASGAIKP